MTDLTPMQLIWGIDYLDAGFTSKPTVISRYALKHKLVTNGEYNFIDILCSYKHTSDNPFPKQDTLADDMGVSTRQIRKYISSLEEKGLLEVEYIYKNDKRVTAAYDFKGLLDACMHYYRQEHMAKDIENGVKKVRKTSKKKKSLVEPQVPVVQEPQVPVGAEPQVPLGQEPQVPVIIDNSNKQLNKQFKIDSKPLSHEIDINQLSLPMPLKKFLYENREKGKELNFDLYELEEFYNTSDYIKPNEHSENLETLNRFEFTKLIKYLYTNEIKVEKSLQALLKTYVIIRLSFKKENASSEAAINESEGKIVDFTYNPFTDK